MKRITSHNLFIPIVVFCLTAALLVSCSSLLAQTGAVGSYVTDSSTSDTGPSTHPSGTGTFYSRPTLAPPSDSSSRAPGTGAPDGFVRLDAVIPDILYDVRYATDNNFVGRPIEGYNANVAYLTNEAAVALRAVADALREQGYVLLVVDGWRPTRTVQYLISWVRDDDDQQMKEQFYPYVDKRDLFRLGYLATRSGHSRGSTVDLTLLYADTLEEVDMGSPFDFFDPISHTYSDEITDDQLANRLVLRDAMVDGGFKPYDAEWWHFTLWGEPYPDTYFDGTVDE